jgi:hypothetical protein
VRFKKAWLQYRHRAVVVLTGALKTSIYLTWYAYIGGKYDCIGGPAISACKLVARKILFTRQFLFSQPSSNFI